MLMVRYMMVNGQRGSFMAMELIHGLMDLPMKVATNMDLNMDMENMFIYQEKYIKVNG